MYELKTLDPKGNRQLPPPARPPRSSESKQHRMMIVALVLLLVALGFVLYHDRDFWFPETQVSQDQLQQTPPATTAPERRAPTATASPTASAPSSRARRRHRSRPQTMEVAAATPAPEDAPPITATTTRTVLPPLEVEVVAGDAHRTVRPGTNSVRVDLQQSSTQPSPPAQTVPDTSTTNAPQTAASVTSNAAERVEMSADAAQVVAQPVNPGYPLLARQMKVEGSVILQALIGRDGLIQDLHVLSGPPILASAAREAVMQWHFKPHYLGAEAVETQARITVNFTISTN